MSGDIGTTPAPKLREPGTPDDVRAAAGIQVTISNLVMTAGLAIIAAEAGVTTFYLEHRSLQGWAGFLLVVAAFLVIAGFIVGGKTLNTLSVKGYYGDWDIFRVSNSFSVQAICNLVAAILVVIAVADGTSPIVDAKDAQLQTLENNLGRTQTQVRALQCEVDALRHERKR